jgi:hypothetical protein
MHAVVPDVNCRVADLYMWPPLTLRGGDMWADKQSRKNGLRSSGGDYVLGSRRCTLPVRYCVCVRGSAIHCSKALPSALLSTTYLALVYWSWLPDLKKGLKQPVE